MNMKKLFLLNLPYLLFVYPFDKLAQAFRLAPGADLSGKLLSIGDGFTAALSSPWLSFHPTDLLIGIVGAVVLRMAVYLKGKNAKKYRHGIEYGSARWGTAADIAPYMDKDFFQNILMTQTERITTPRMRKRRDTRMKHNFMAKMASALLAVVLSTAAFSVTAFASGGEETTESLAEQETAGDVSDLLSALAGSQVTVSITEDGIQFSSGENDSEQTGTVTTGGGNLNVRTGAGMDYTAFAQLPNGTTVKVIGTDGDWLKVILPEKVGYVYSGYMTVSDGEAGSGEGSFSLDAETLENLLGILGGGLNGGAALTPDGNLSLIDDIGSPTASGKQFITVETKNGNVFYLIIDRDDEGEETVHFLNQVDEADLMALTEDGEKAETPIVCTCTEKCQAGAVNTACPVCVKNLSECVGTEQKAAEPTEPENPEPEKKSNTGAILAVLLILAAGGGAAVYFLVLKPKQGKKVPADLDDFDLEDEEEYLTEDEETEEKNE